MEQASQMIGPYVLVRNLGSGSTSKIKLAIHQETKMPVAIKIIKKESFQENPQLQPKIQREIALMRLFDHPHILKLLDILESPRHLYIGLEYASRGELFDYVVTNNHLDEKQAMNFFRQIVYGLEYLHSLGICHRDLKPENILLDEKLNIKIADFGFARFTKSNTAETSCGSPHYVAPEVIGGDVYDGKAADVWSCGVILYAMLTGNLPFDDPSIRTLLCKVRKAQFVMPPVSAPFQDLISRMLTKDPKQRIKISEIKRHPAFIQDLPADYIQPTPLPLPSMSTPIDPDTIPSDYRDILRKIGYPTDEELNADLSAPEATMAKVFYSMLTSKLMIDQLDWDKSVGGNSFTLSGSSSFESFIMAGNGLETSSFMRGASFAANGPQSLARPADWVIPPQDPAEFSETRTILTYPLPLFEVMTIVQKQISALQMQWFYPDETMIICRQEEKDLYVLINYELDGQLLIRRCEGNMDNFAVICYTIDEAINRAIMPNDD